MLYTMKWLHTMSSTRSRDERGGRQPAGDPGDFEIVGMLLTRTRDKTRESKHRLKLNHDDDQPPVNATTLTHLLRSSLGWASALIAILLG